MRATSVLQPVPRSSAEDTGFLFHRRGDGDGRQFCFKHGDFQSLYVPSAALTSSLRTLELGFTKVLVFLLSLAHKDDEHDEFLVLQGCC